MTDLQPLYEQIAAHGAAALSTQDLLSLTLHLRSETAQRVLKITSGFNNATAIKEAQLREIEDVDQNELSRLLGFVELLRRISATTGEQRVTIRTAADAAAMLRDMGGLVQEQVRVILLDTQSRVMDIVTVYIGTLNISALRAAEIYREAILRGCAAIILAHNHPSGNPQPSPEDVQTTRGLAAAGKLLDIPMRDHLIIGREGWVSLRELGLM